MSNFFQVVLIIVLATVTSLPVDPGNTKAVGGLLKSKLGRYYVLNRDDRIKNHNRKNETEENIKKGEMVEEGKMGELVPKRGRKFFTCVFYN